MTSYGRSDNSLNDKFTIAKGVENTFVFTVKKNATTLPITIAPSDSFTAHIKLLSDRTTVLSKALTVVDAPSGRVELKLTSAETGALTSKRGEEVDRYYSKPVYMLLIECSTVDNGDFLAKVPFVYVD